jgi:iron(III) transport system substrate-binding protein
MTLRHLLWLLLALAMSGCRVESVSPRAAERGGGEAGEPSGDLWVYTSMFPSVLEDVDALAKAKLPKVTVHWFNGGSEKVANKLEGEFAAGGTKADILAISDPFLYERFKEEKRWLRYAPPDALRMPRAMLDEDGYYFAHRVSVMILAHKADTPGPLPRTFRELTDPRFRGAVAVGDPLTSGTNFTWATFLGRKYGPTYFADLRANGAVVAGGNAAVQQKIETGEVKVGVLLMENVLHAREKGDALAFTWPEDDAVTIPGYAAIFASTANPVAAKAFMDMLLSPEGQAAMVRGRMYATDPRLDGPHHEGNLASLLEKSLPWDPGQRHYGLTEGAAVKTAFMKAFGQ